MDIKVGRNWGLFAAALPWSIIGSCCLWCGLSAGEHRRHRRLHVSGRGHRGRLRLLQVPRGRGAVRLALAYAICDIILGVLFIVHPIASAVVIPWVMGIFVVAYGIFEIVAAVRFRDALPGWGWVLFAGIVSLFCGIAFFLWPGTFALFLGFFLMARGVQMAVYGVSLPQATIVAHTH